MSGVSKAGVTNHTNVTDDTAVSRVIDGPSVQAEGVIEFLLGGPGAWLLLENGDTLTYESGNTISAGG